MCAYEHFWASRVVVSSVADRWVELFKESKFILCSSLGQSLMYACILSFSLSLPPFLPPSPPFFYSTDLEALFMPQNPHTPSQKGP